MSFPTQSASALVESLDKIASANGGNAFVSDLQYDPHGENYRAVTIDITRQDWKRIHAALLNSGWRSFGGGLAHDLQDENVLLAVPNF